MPSALSGNGVHTRRATVAINLDFFEAIDADVGFDFKARTVPLDNGKWTAILDGPNGGVLVADGITQREALRDAFKAVLKRLPDRKAVGV